MKIQLINQVEIEAEDKCFNSVYEAIEESKKTVTVLINDNFSPTTKTIVVSAIVSFQR